MPQGDPRQAPNFDPDVERAKQPMSERIAEASRDTLGDFGSAVVRPAVKAVTGLPFMPIDAATGVANFIRQGDFSRDAFLRGANPFAQGSPDDYQGPSQRLDQMLDQYTQAPSDTPGRVAEMISSGVLGSRLPGLRAPTPRPAVNPSRADLAMIEGQRQRVPVYFDDYSQNPLVKKVGVAAENVPVVGTAAGRAAQAEAAKQAALRLTGRYTADLEDDVPALVQEGMQRRLAALKGSAGVLYNRVAAQLDPRGTVPTTQFDRAIGRELAHQEGLGTAANQSVVEILEKYDAAPRGNFTFMRNLRSQLGDEIRDYYSGGKNKAIGQKGVERLRELRNSLETDMGDFADRGGGGAQNAWRTANAFYRANLMPFKEQGFADLVRTAEPEKAWRYLMTQGGIDSRATRMYNALDTQGRAAVRGGVVQDAMTGATNPDGKFSPARFAKYMEDHDTVINQFFHGNELQQLRGFNNLMRHVVRAGQYMENPPTGNRLIGAAMAGAASIAPKTIAAIAGTAGTVRTLFQTETGRNLLIAASKLRPGSPAMHEISEQMRLTLARAATTAPSFADEENRGDHLQLNPVGEVTGEPAEQ